MSTGGVLKVPLLPALKHRPLSSIPRTPTGLGGGVSKQTNPTSKRFRPVTGLNALVDSLEGLELEPRVPLLTQGVGEIDTHADHTSTQTVNVALSTSRAPKIPSSPSMPISDWVQRLTSPTKGPLLLQSITSTLHLRSQIRILSILNIIIHDQANTALSQPFSSFDPYPSHHIQIPLSFAPILTSLQLAISETLKSQQETSPSDSTSRTKRQFPLPGSYELKLHCPVTKREWLWRFTQGPSQLITTDNELPHCWIYRAFVRAVDECGEVVREKVERELEGTGGEASAGAGASLRGVPGGCEVEQKDGQCTVKIFAVCEIWIDKAAE